MPRSQSDMPREAVFGHQTGPAPAIVAALSSNGVIGRNNTLPWRLPADLRHFKYLTLGKPIVMGRKTYESIGRPLPGRENIVVSRDPGLVITGCRVCSSLEAALALARDLEPVHQAMVIGGGELYRQVLPLAGWMYLTRIHCEIEGDTFFPEIEPGQWREIRREDHPGGVDTDLDYSFIDYRRVAG